MSEIALSQARARGLSARLILKSVNFFRRAPQNAEK
jgi:hypothetical protein